MLFLIPESPQTKRHSSIVLWEQQESHDWMSKTTVSGYTNMMNGKCAFLFLKVIYKIFYMYDFIIILYVFVWCWRRLNFKVLPWDHSTDQSNNTCFTAHADSDSNTVETRLHSLKIHCVLSLKHVSVGLVRLILQQPSFTDEGCFKAGRAPCWTLMEDFSHIGTKHSITRQGVKIFYCLIAISLNWPIFLPIL